jgi:glycosyltransferase involved in cell wall biosynthesis
MGRPKSKKTSKRPVVRLYNTVEPVISLFRAVGEGLLDHGYDVEIVVTGAQYRSGGVTLGEWAERLGVRLVSIPGIRTYPRNALFKGLIALYFSAFSVVYGLLGRNTAINIFLTQPPMFYASGPLFRRLRGQRYACVTMDLYPEVLAAAGTLSDGSLVYSALRSVAHWALRNADAVVSIGRCMTARLERAGVANERIWTITNWAEPWLSPASDPEAVHHRPYLAELGLHDKFVFLYAGNMGVAHTFDELLWAADQLKTDDAARFLIVGEGARKDEVQHAIADKRLSNVVSLPYQSREKVAHLMVEADCHVVTQREGFDGLVVPSKAYSALGVGKPLLYVGSEDGEIARMILEESVGIVVPPGDLVSMVDACTRLVTDRENVAGMARRARELAQGAFSQAHAKSRYLGLIEATLGKRR